MFFFFYVDHFKVFITFLQYCFSFLCFDFLTTRHEGLSSPTRDQTYTLCIGTQSLNHWTTREFPKTCNFDLVVGLWMTKKDTSGWAKCLCADEMFVY